MKELNKIILLFLTFFCTSCVTVSPITGNTTMTDNDITTGVQVKFAHDAGLADQTIHVNTFERVVTLTGNVQNPTQASVAIVLAKSVPDVKCVISKLKIVRIKD